MQLPVLLAIFSSVVFGIIAIIISLREQKTRRTYSENEKSKLMSMVKGLEDGVFMLDVNRKLTIINEAAKSFLGIQKNVVSESDIYLSLADKFDLFSKIEQAIKNFTPTEEKEVQLQEKTVQVFIHPVFDIITGRAIGVSVLLHDITLEKTLTQHKEDFTNMVVHELRAPLTAIKGSSELIVKNRSMLSEEEQVKLLTIIHEQSTRLLDEVTTILDAAKLESGKFTLNKTNADLSFLINERIEFFLPQALEKHIALSSENTQPLPQIAIDTFRIGQVLNNLLSNSLKFTPDYGQITVGAKQQGLMVVVWVKDTGIGIPKEEQEKIFSKYYQVTAKKADVSPLKKQPGTGLGLFIIKGIIEAHGGNISFESQQDRGTTFSFTLPLNTLPQQPKKNDLQAPLHVQRTVN